MLSFHKNKPGFTLIELSLVLAVVSVLAIIIALIINGILSVYIRGITIKNVNTLGREMIEDFATTIAGSPQRDLDDICSLLFPQGGTEFDKCRNDKAYYYTYSARYSGDNPVSGAFCTGRYSYIWNTGYALNNSNSDQSLDKPALVRYNDSNGNEQELTNFRLIKFIDQSNVACLSRTEYRTGRYSLINDTNNVYDLRSDANSIVYTLQNAPEELIAQNDANLALYDFQVFRPAQDYPTFHAYYTGSFILGTLGGGVNILSNGDYCKPPADYDSDFNYCSVNRFNFAAETVGG